MHLKTTTFSFFDKVELKDALFQNRSFPAHFHDTYSIGIIEKGIEKLAFGNKEIITMPKSIVLINPFEIHANSCFDDDVIQYKTVYIHQEAFDFIAKKQNLNSIAHKVSFKNEPIQDSKLYHLISNFHNHHNENTEQQLSNILTYLLHNPILQTEKKERKEKHSITLVEDTTCYLKENLFEKVNLEDWARKQQMSKFKLIRTFKQETGLTPIAYQLVHRIDMAKKMIRQQIPLLHIAFETGFYDQSHFIHYFKYYTGVTPKEYKAGLTIH